MESGTNLEGLNMTKYHSLVFRLTGIIFFLFIMTIGILLFLVNYQMDHSQMNHEQMHDQMNNNK